MVDDDVAAGLQPDLGPQGFVELLLDAELLEDRRGLGVKLDAANELGLEAADKLDDLAELFFVVDPDGGVIVADVIAQDALDEIQIAMQQRFGTWLRGLHLARGLLPGTPEELDVRARSLLRRALCAVRTMKPPGNVPLASLTRRRRRERSSAEAMRRDTPMWFTVGM